jgi:bifunctional DNA-binding transcriptional regulator/antitoxin component of YhaV-PrlF toxin-antitoxin module
MQTLVSTKGQVVLPGPILRRLSIRAGDLLDAEIHAGRIIADPVTGLPVLSAGAEAPVLSSKEVDEILANVP